MTKGDTTTNAEVPYFISLDSNGLFAGVRTGAVSQVVRFDLTGVSANVWHHMAATFTASTRVLTLYLDGVQVAQTTVSGFSSVGNWRFEDGSGTAAADADNTGTPQNGALGGGVSWSTDVHP